MASITCKAGDQGKHTHFSVEAVRQHFLGETEPCTWLVQDADQDGMPITRDCGALAWLTHDGDGFECEAGHSHVGMATQEREGWGYAEDEWDAAVLARAGKGYRPMGPSTTIDEVLAAQLMSQL